MNHRKKFLHITSPALAMLLLTACSLLPTFVPEHAAVQTVRAFHEAINAIEPGEETGEGKVNVGKGFNALSGIFREYTTMPGTQMNMLTLTMASGQVRFSNMDYELVSESAECAIVKATGDIAIAGEEGTLDEKYVVVKQGEKWLIDPNAKSCD